jgi:3-isopropylmalate/(R)-2-methylmalate dehydratase small subunit
MQAFTRIEAVAVPMRDADIDTDQILPARFMHKPRENYGQYCFHDLRIDSSTARERQGFVLNKPGFREASVIVTGPNFGCGSSREQAVHTLLDFGFRALLGTGFGDIFFNNCVKNGVLPVRLPAPFIARLFDALEHTPGAHVVVDLHTQSVSAPDGSKASFAIDPFQKDALLQGTDEIDFTLGLAREIDLYEARHGLTRR